MDKVIQKTIGDTVCRVHKTADFTMLSNGFIGSTNISCQAILLLAQAMSLPKNWNFTIKGLEKICAVGETAVRNMLKELETWGYLVRTKLMPSITSVKREVKTEKAPKLYDLTTLQRDANKNLCRNLPTVPMLSMQATLTRQSTICFA